MATTPNFALDILNCPPDGNIKSIVYQSPTKMCVIQGAETLMCIDLKDFFIPVTDALRTSFTIKGSSSSELPLLQTAFDYCNLGGTSGVKFASFFFDYGSTSSSDSQYVQWAFSNELEGPLAVLSPTLIDDSGSTAGATGSDTGYDLNLSYSIIKIDGTKFGLVSVEAFAIATRAGLKFWSETDGVILLNTYNSEIPTNNLSCITYAEDGTIWIGTHDEGVLKLSWNNSKYVFTQFKTTNSSIISNQINDVFLSNDLLAIATELGISLYDTGNLTWKNYSRTNVNEINESSFNSVFLDSGYLLAGSTNGVYVQDISANTWEIYNSSTNGWNISNAVNKIVSFEQEVYVGVEDGLLTFSIGSTSCQEISMPFGPTSSYLEVSDIFYVQGTSGQDSLVVSSLAGAISSYDILGSTWSFSYVAPGGTSSNLMTDGISKIYSDDYVYFANISGFGRFDSGVTSVDSLPLSTQTSDILFSYPMDGQFPVSISQKIYLGFSKEVNQTVLNNHISFSNAVTGATVSYSLTSANGYLYEIIPSSDFSYATLYNFSVLEGLTSTDGKYFRQTVETIFASYDKNPINGWKVAGKQLTLSGAEGFSVNSIIFRNPQTFDIPVTALIAV